MSRLLSVALPVVRPSSESCFVVRDRRKLAAGSFGLPAVIVAALAVVLEDGTAAAWVRVLDQAAERSTRELAIEALTGAEVRAVGWRTAAGQTPVTTALPGLPQD